MLSFLNGNTIDIRDDQTYEQLIPITESYKYLSHCAIDCEAIEYSLIFSILSAYGFNSVLFLTPNRIYEKLSDKKNVL